jgi:NADPH-dependent ferric siderophore reductase
VLIVADESGVPAAAGVLRDLSDDAKRSCIFELFDLAKENVNFCGYWRIGRTVPG